MEQVDPESAAKLHPNDEKRIIRALEVYQSTGKTITQHNLETRAIPPRYDALTLALALLAQQPSIDGLYANLDKMDVKPAARKKLVEGEGDARMSYDLATIHTDAPIAFKPEDNLCQKPDEPKLYQLLFMRENRSAVSFDDVFGELGDTMERCVEAVCRDYDLSPAQARVLFEHVWIYTFGVGALCATRVCRFSEEQLGRMLSTEFQAMMLLVKSGGQS